MKANTIRVVVSQKIVIGDFETINPTVEIEAEIDQGESIQEAYQAARSAAEKLWLQEAVFTLKAVVARRLATGLNPALAQAILAHLASQYS